MAKRLRKALTVSASLVIAALGIYLTGKYTGFLGPHFSLAIPVFPLYALASFYLLDYFFSILIRGGEAGGPGETPVKKFSWMALVSLILGSAGHFFLLNGGIVTEFVFGIAGFAFSIGGVVTGHAARQQHQKGPGLRGIGMANVGLLLGYLNLLLFFAGLLCAIMMTGK